MQYNPFFPVAARDAVLVRRAMFSGGSGYIVVASVDPEGNTVRPRVVWWLCRANKKAHALTRHPTATDPHPKGMRPCYHQCIRLPHRHFPAGHRHGHHLRGECRRDGVAPHDPAEVHQHHAAAGGGAAHAPARVLHFPRVPGHADAAAVPC